MTEDLSFDVNAWLMEFEKEEFLSSMFYVTDPTTGFYQEEIYD
jgi:hypothetical protein